MTKVIVFDMDGTIADLYGVKGWLEDLRNSNPRPYIEAKPLYDMNLFAEILDMLSLLGWRIVITSWLSKDATAEYDKEVRKAKRAWLDQFGLHIDEYHFVKYGTTKANCTRQYGGLQILVDDNADVRNGWTLGGTIDASNTMSMLNRLLDIIDDEMEG